LFAANLEPHPNTDRLKPKRFDPISGPSATAFKRYKNQSQSLLEEYMKKVSILRILVVLMSLTLTGSVMASQNNSEQSNARKAQVTSGQKMKTQGVILRRDSNSFVMRDTTGAELTVQLTSNTKVEEKKGNPFRGAKKHSSDEVIRGLFVEVEGRGGAAGDLVAEKIKFSDDAQRVALSVESQVVPVEGRVGQAETRITEAEQNAQRLSGQVEELTQVANLAKGGAAAAQQTAEAAVQGVNQTNDRITSLDQYEEKTTTTVNFRVGSAVLSQEAKEMLDQIATQAKSEQGFVIEVRGFASADGSANMNDRLSERRADAVVRYLAQQHEIPLRRIVLPFGYGEAIPVADNTTREGRKQNRRVEVKILVSRGLTSPVNVSRPVGGNN
jgi:outer membrane protein OmpA-like peptidoglycan-associated protein